jgi:hypothetical protein
MRAISYCPVKLRCRLFNHFVIYGRVNLQRPTDALFDAGSALAEIMINVRNAPEGET